jgi:hypothetical protein
MRCTRRDLLLAREEAHDGTEALKQSTNCCQFYQVIALWYCWTFDKLVPHFLLFFIAFFRF